MLTVSAIPAFSDNYIWMICDPHSPSVYVVDPGDAEPVKQRLESENRTLAGILVTHWHGDHIGGINSLLAAHDVPVIGPDSDNIPQVTVKVHEGEQVDIFGHSFSVLEVPGHTLDHIAFFAENDAKPLLFCGDTLFAGGCGRMFEGTAEVFHHSLAKLKSLPANTRVFCAHEYTQANLRFAKAVEPANKSLLARIEDVAKARNRGLATVPSSLEMELQTNPFLRADQATVVNAAEMQSKNSANPASSLNEIEVFATLRSWKDNF